MCKKIDKRRGKYHHMWKNGTRKDHGYIRILAKDHPFCDNKGYVLEHRLIIEKTLNRYLTPKEIIHHKDSNKANNDLKNLQLFSSRGGKHFALHHFKILKGEK